MKIVLVPLGDIDNRLLDALREDLEALFTLPVEKGHAMAVPGDAYDGSRDQYNSTVILQAVAEDRGTADVFLAVTDRDLYANGLNFVFGEAFWAGAVVSTARLAGPHHEGAGSMFSLRLLKEAVHELGHVFGLGHCLEPSCVMFFSNSLEDTDRKGPGFCSRCAELLAQKGVIRSS